MNRSCSLVETSLSDGVGPYSVFSEGLPILYRLTFITLIVIACSTLVEEEFEVVSHIIWIQLHEQSVQSIKALVNPSICDNPFTKIHAGNVRTTHHKFLVFEVNSEIATSLKPERPTCPLAPTEPVIILLTFSFIKKFKLKRNQVSASEVFVCKLHTVLRHGLVAISEL